MPRFDRAEFNAQYAEHLSALKEAFDEYYLSHLETFSAIASAELPEDEQIFYSTTSDPESSDGREPYDRYIFDLGKEVAEDVYRFGTHLDTVRQDGTWNFGVVRRHVTVQLRPICGDMVISTFVFEDRGGLGDPDRHALWMPSVPLSFNSEWNIEHFLAHTWDMAVHIDRKQLIPQNRGWWENAPHFVPCDLIQELS